MRFCSLHSLADLFIEPPKLDLDAYIANYRGKRPHVSSTFRETRNLTASTGRTRFERLLLIGTSSSYLYLEALKAAVAEAKQGIDVQRYETAVSYIREIAPNDLDAIPDSDWIDRMKKQVKGATDKMELELKGYKNNLIKESIRVCYVSSQAQAHQLTAFSKDGVR